MSYYGIYEQTMDEMRKSLRLPDKVTMFWFDPPPPKPPKQIIMPIQKKLLENNHESVAIYNGFEYIPRPPPNFY